MNTQEQAEARSRLEQEVKEMKTREDSGQKERAASLHEERMMTRGLKNVITAGDVLKELLPKWEAKAREMKEFFDKLNEHVLKLDPVYCVDHEDTQIPINMDRSRSESWIDREFSIVYDKCPKCHPEEKSTDLVNEKWKKMGIPSNLYSSTIENFDIDTEPKKRAVSKIYKQLEKSGGFIILRGTVGTGKTHLAVGVIKHFGDGILVTEADLVGELRETYSSNIGQDKMVSKYRKPKVLVLDELTQEVKGIDIRTLLYRIFAYRYSENLLSVITSNDTLETIIDILGPKIMDRIKHGYKIITLDGESYRNR